MKVLDHTYIDGTKIELLKTNHPEWGLFSKSRPWRRYLSSTTVQKR